MQAHPVRLSQGPASARLEPAHFPERPAHQWCAHYNRDFRPLPLIPAVAELEEIFAHAPKDPTAAVLADEAVRKKYSEVTGEKSLAGTVTRQPITSDPWCGSPRTSPALVWLTLR